VGTEFFHADRRTDGRNKEQTDRKKLEAAFRKRMTFYKGKVFVTIKDICIS